MIRIKIATAALLLFAFTQTALSQQTHQFSLQQALEYAQKNNVQVKNALLDIQLQQQVNREVTGSAFPQINASGDITDNLKLPISIIPAGTVFMPGTPYNRRHPAGFWSKMEQYGRRFFKPDII
ncbi:hypothetical protein LWM68_01795 [Niabella sp. W65]|nr:hypothetical protein [Niabella sp. W65]MCH7361629.1 hypothetical protein [Niabella sp. W65]ULT45410.1 hypothetical protein KRR40_20320 [Niabella sp. I65]